MVRYRDIRIVRLTSSDARPLAEMLQSAPAEYSQHFIPFAFDFGTISGMLASASADRYCGIFLDAELAGFYMLRGFDQGYAIPSYGVWIAPQHCGQGLAQLTLFHAFSFCRANGIRTLMLKVHPENSVAKKLYERNGFIRTGTDARNNHSIYQRTFARS
jgi:RimJ/RimL family protein N-acetyltransferase